MTARTDERKQFLFDVFVTAIEGGINYWAAVDVYRPYKLDDHGKHTRDENLDGFYADIVDSEQGDRDNEPYRVDIDVIAKGIGLFVDHVTGRHDDKPMREDHYWRQFLAANRSNGDEGDYDSDVADAIVQLGLFGQIVYG